MEHFLSPFSWRLWAVLFSLVMIALACGAQPAVQARVDGDLAAGKPIVVHVVVALCDNANQGIVPVPAAIGNGQDPKSNLYWGAMYGDRTHLPRKAGWRLLTGDRPEIDGVLERAFFHTTVQRGGKQVPVYLVADAWDGARMREAMQLFLEMSAGRQKEKLTVEAESLPVELNAGGAAHLMGFVGHNGLMDFSVAAPAAPAADAPPRAAIVLACASKPYFTGHLSAAAAEAVLLTTGLMAPEAYTLDAAIREWAAGGDREAVAGAAAKVYNQYQKCGIRGARRLFGVEPE